MPILFSALYLFGLVIGQNKPFAVPKKSALNKLTVKPIIKPIRFYY
jgi:hypothetical protein